METVTRSESVRFGNFELDLRTRELLRNGSRLKIRGHPVDVLAILVEHPGELVTRETLQKRLWPDNTFVDFEQILNNSVGKLRDALGDRPEAPRFIETLPRPDIGLLPQSKAPRIKLKLLRQRRSHHNRPTPNIASLRSAGFCGLRLGLLSRSPCSRTGTCICRCPRPESPITKC